MHHSSLSLVDEFRPFSSRAVGVFAPVKIGVVLFLCRKIHMHTGVCKFLSYSVCFIPVLKLNLPEIPLAYIHKYFLLGYLLLKFLPLLLVLYGKWHGMLLCQLVNLQKFHWVSKYQSLTHSCLGKLVGVEKYKLSIFKMMNLKYKCDPF